MADIAELQAQVAALTARIDGLTGGEEDVHFLTTADGDAFWLLFGTVLVFFMQAGFAMLEVGSVRLKNTKNILIKNIFDASIAAIFWWWTGYALAFGQDDFGDKGTNGFAGTTGWGYTGEKAESMEGKTYGKAFFLFQWAFAGAAATIVSGAVAERCKFIPYLIYSVVITGFVYPIVVHVAWSSSGKLSPWREGRLFADCGVIDFAGSGVVHLTGGTAAFVGAHTLGPRIGFTTNIASQSVIFQTLGTLMLWVGWYGFNGVSTLALAGKGGLAAHVMMNTTISAATSCIATTLLGYLMDGIIDTRNANNGILAGLVSVTAGCAVVNPWGAFVIGVIAAPVYLFASKTLVHFGVDDVVDASPVHGACGAWGVLAASLFATEYYYKLAYYTDDARAEDCQGAFYGGDGSSVAAAVVFILFVVAWVGSTTMILFRGLKATIGIRVSEMVEEAGMDGSKHGGTILEELANQDPEKHGSKHGGELSFMTLMGGGGGGNANRDLDLSVNLGMDNSKHGPSFVSGPKVGAVDIADGDPIDI